MDYDPERLLQIVHNLLSNAIKFTPSGGKVLMTATVAGNTVVITVTDTGIGIPEDDLPYVFDRFFQAKLQESMPGDPIRRSAMRTGGSGIGLSLTRELVQAMGGEISVASPVPGENSGTIFTVKLPVSNNAVMSTGESDVHHPSDTHVSNYKSQSNPESDFSVLLIEDNPDVMEYLASCLGARYRLDYAFNGRAGIEKALEITPDLIVSDVMMPEKDGFEVCDFLKHDERTSHIPVVLLTAKVSMEARITGLRRGADAYLAKPFHEEELLVWVEQLINRQRMLQARYANLTIAAQPDEPKAPSENFEMEDAFVIKFKTILDANYTDPELTVEIVAAKMGMSRTQLYRKLNSLTGQSINVHLNTLRLEKA
jgi:CheY-like chemotaxis protein